MTPLERRRFELHAEQPGYRKRIREARAHIKLADGIYETPYVSISGGKDSTVLYHLTIETLGYHLDTDDIDIDVFQFDWGLRNVPGINDHVDDLADTYGGTLIRRTSEGVTDEATFAADEHEGIQGLMGWVATLAERRGWDCGLLGIRAEESPKRRDQYTGRPPTAHEGPLPNVAPIHHLTTADVWAYIVDNELPYPDHYDEQGQLLDGIDDRANRLVTIYDHEFASQGSEPMSQFVYPDTTNDLKRIEHEHAEDPS